MKVRNGFVSNSSSASFIIKVSSSLSEEEMKSYSKDFILEEKKDGENIYKLCKSTIMFNDWRDVPEWKLVRAVYENRIGDIDLVDIIQSESEFSDMYEKHDPDFNVWDKDKGEQSRMDAEYSRYLISIGVDVSNQDIKNILNS